MKVFKLLAILLGVFSCGVAAFAEAPEKQNSFVEIIDQIRKSVVFLAKIDNKSAISEVIGTGCLLNVHGIFHVLTARHNIQAHTLKGFEGDISDADLSVLFRTPNGSYAGKPLKEVRAQNNLSWILPSDATVDLAIVPFLPLDLKNNDVKAIPESLFADRAELVELYDIFFASFQPGASLDGNLSPVFRRGTISQIYLNKKALIDGSVFPGNSGSPVFLTPSPIRFDKGGVSIGGDTLGGKFIGIVGSYLPYREVAVSLQTKRPRVIFEENTGLSVVWTTDAIMELLNSNDFRRQVGRLTK